MEAKARGEAKSPLRSKTIQFNSLTGVVAMAIWPFIPEDFRESEHAMQAVIAWLTIGNILLRLFTKKALKWRKERETDT